jgi:hypothetical protein
VGGLMALVNMDGDPLVNPEDIPDAQVMTNLELTAYVAGITATLVRLFGPDVAQHIAINAANAEATLTALHASLNSLPYVPPTDADIDRYAAPSDDDESTDWSDIS